VRAQIQRLIEATALPCLTLQVVPFSVGAHPAMVGAFILLNFPSEDPSVIFVEYHAGALYLENREDVARYRLLLDHLRATALSTGASRDFMARIMDEMA
jgi:hypothetical protein